MMGIKVSILAELIAKHTFLKDGNYTSEKLQETVNYILEYIDIIGEDNLRLRNSLNIDKTVFYFRKRETPLSGDEIVIGEYLLFEYTGHNEDMYLKQLNSLSEIEEEITSGGGITNTFTTYQIPFINGVVWDYDIYFINDKDGIEYKFIKDVHDDLPEYKSIFSKANKPSERIYKITNVKIVWNA
jgi:hypothetical protein